MGVQPHRALPSAIPLEHSLEPGCGHTDQPGPWQGLSAWGEGHCRAARTWLHSEGVAPPAAIRRALWSSSYFPHPTPLAPSVVCSPSAERAGGWGTGRQCAEQGGGPTGRTDPWGGEWARPTSLFKQSRPQCSRTPSRAETLLSSWPGQRGPRWTQTLVPSTHVGNVPQPRAHPTSSPPGTVPFPHAGHGISPAPPGWRFPPRQLPGASPLLRPGILPVWAAPALAVEVPEHAVVDLAGDLLLLQHLLDGLPSRASLDRLPSLARLLGLNGNTTLRFL